MIKPTQLLYLGIFVYGIRPILKSHAHPNIDTIVRFMRRYQLAQMHDVPDSDSYMVYSTAKFQFRPEYMMHSPHEICGSFVISKREPRPTRNIVRIANIIWLLLPHET